MQVLLGLQSNALKFTKPGGRILISCEFIKGVYTKTKTSSKRRTIKGIQVGGGVKGNLKDNNEIMSKFVNEFEKVQTNESDASSASSDGEFEKDHNLATIREQDSKYDKIVISVVDTGIGIKKKDKKKLFKLFGCLQNTR